MPLFPEGGPGRHLKARLAAGEVLVCAMVAEYARPSLMKLYSQAGIDFVFFEYEHAYFSPTALADTVLAARDSGMPPVAKTPQLDRQEIELWSAASSASSYHGQRAGPRSRICVAT